MATSPENPFAALTDFQDDEEDDIEDDLLMTLANSHKSPDILESASMEDYVPEVNLPNVDETETKSESEEETTTRSSPSLSVGSPFVPPSERPDAPLAGILKPEYQNIDPRRYFPDYKRTGVLRYSKMFGVNPKALNQNMIWWPSKTFCKKVDQKPKDEAEPKNFTLNISTKVTKDECELDQSDLLLKSEAELEALRNPQNDEDDEPPPWRFGPAQMWYDRLGLSEKPYHFDYGFKISRFNIVESTSKKPVTSCGLSNEELLPVNMLQWENDIIMDSSEIDYKKCMNGREPKCGWISTQQTRTYQAYKAAFSSDDVISGPDLTHSIFPTDNFELENVRWEDNVILDSENMPAIPKPRVLNIEYEDDPAIFGMPEDQSSEDKAKDDGSRGFDRKDHKFTKKSKMILSQVQRRQKQEEEEHMESRTAQNADRDVFNMSNDEYYAPKNTHRAIGSGSAIQHSIPAQNIHHAYFPTHMDVHSLRHLYRQPPSKRIIKFLIDREVFIQNALGVIADAEERRKHQTMMDSAAEIFHMRTLRDLSARDGTLICIEYSEEHPPLLSQPGMASKIRNYHRRKTQKDSDSQFEFGETAFTMNSPFLGNLSLGQSLQALENNMYRAPIFQHKATTTDFILIRCADGLFLRECPAMFVAGQECPLYEVPSPNSKKATAFGRDSLLAFIYRLFWESEHQPRRLRMEEIKDAFPDYPESSIRKRLKQCSDFTRSSSSGADQSYWAIKDDFRLPSKEEVLAMLTPEMCCAYYSMQAAEQRLKDAGYGEKHFLTPENDDESDDQVTMEDEIKCAPWNTTRAYLSATKGKCLLDQTGVADPTGCGQGFSYVRVTQKPQKEDIPQMPKRLVTGTNADLRKLPLKEAKDICRSYGIREEEINSLTRWEIIDVIRTLSTQAAKARADFSGMGRFARGNIRFNSADAQDKYKQYCQHVFDLQNEVLASTEHLSTDDGSGNEDSDNEDMASKLEKMLDSGKGQTKDRSKAIASSSNKVIETEDEEKERLALQRMIHGDAASEKVDDKKTAKDENASQQPTENTVIRKLRIHRIFKAPDGTESDRVEIINNQQVINGYDQIRRTADPEFIKVYATMDDDYKEERRKEKRRLQDQLRRIKRKEQKSKAGAPIGRPKKKPVEVKPPPPIKPSLAKMKCSACGQLGHMKTNKHCPFYGQRLEQRKEKTVGDICKGTTSNLALEDMSLASGELMSSEGTRIKFSHKLFQHLELERKKALKLRIPAEFINQQKTIVSADESSRASISSQLKVDVEDDTEDSFNFRHDLSSPASTAGSSTARTPLPGRSGFQARRRGTIEDADYLIGPIKSVHRRRADPKVSISTIFLEILVELKALSGSKDLLHPVNPKQVPDYYTIVKAPMDLLQVRSRIQANKYELRSQFMADLALILNNSKMYNGPIHPITLAATQLVELALTRIKENEVRLIELEKMINPLLDENDLVGFSYILTDIVQHCKNLPKSAAFHSRVDPRKHVNYYDRIKQPMDLGTIEQKVKDQQYRTTTSFLTDMEQIYKNSVIYNGEFSPYTEKAKEILDHASKLVEEKGTELQELQSRIEAPAAAVDNQSLDYNTMEEDNDEATRDTFIQLDDQETQHDAEASCEVIMPTDDEATMDAWDNTAAAGLVGSQMQMSGQLNADLELTDSDSDNEGPSKRPRLDEDLEEL